MALFEQKVWTDRQVQFPSRRKLTNVNTQEEKTVIVERNEGIIYEEGNLFDAANINDLEERVAAAFNEIEESLNNRINLYYPVGKIFMAVTDLHLEQPDQQVFPGTTWVRLENRVLLPVDPETEESGVEGGSNTIEITPSGKLNLSNVSIQPHSITVDEMPRHKHDSYAGHSLHYNPGSAGGSPSGGFTFVSQPQTFNTEYPPQGASVINKTKSHTHGLNLYSTPTMSFSKITSNNMQKCITIYAWRRVT